MSESKQHVQLPNDMTMKTGLKPKDLLIYVSIKKHMNKDTLEAFPSQETIAKTASSTPPTVKKCVERLVEAEFISIRKLGRKTVYKFNPHKNFEPFSYDFLDNDNLSFTAKSYLLASQQFMFKDIEGYGKISLNDFQMSKIINMSPQTIARTNKELENAGVLYNVPLKNREESGLNKIEKIYDLGALGQQIVFEFNKVNERLNEVSESQRKENQIILNYIRNLEKRIKTLENKDTENDLDIIV